MHIKKFLVKNKKAGMSFVEMIVVISIFAVMTSAVFFNERGYSDSISFQNGIADFALTLKEVQTKALSGIYPPVAFNQSPPLDTWKNSFGFYYSVIQGKKIIYFFDRDNDGKYNGAVSSGNNCGTATSECIKEIPLDIKKASMVFCANTRSNPTGEFCGLFDAHIVFTRPKVDASIITSDIRVTNPIGDVTFKFTENGVTRTVSLWSTGLIETK